MPLRPASKTASSRPRGPKIGIPLRGGAIDRLRQFLFGFLGYRFTRSHHRNGSTDGQCQSKSACAFGRRFLAFNDAKALPLFQQFAGDNSSHGDDVHPVSAFAVRVEYPWNKVPDGTNTGTAPLRVALLGVRSTTTGAQRCMRNPSQIEAEIIPKDCYLIASHDKAARKGV